MLKNRYQILIFSGTMSRDRPENHAFHVYDLTKYHKKLSFGLLFGKHCDRAELAGVYRVIQNVLPALGNSVSSLIYLDRMCNPIGKGAHTDEKIVALSEQMMEMVLNHPSTKDGMVNILRKLLSDTNNVHLAKQQITNDVIALLSRCYHILMFAMCLLGSQMKMMQSKRLIGRHLMSQFCKQTRFGRLVEQIEFIAQQYHNVFFRGIEGMSIKGTPRLILDLSDVTYTTSGAFEKWTRKTEESEKYLQIRGRMQSLDVECQGKVQILHLKEKYYRQYYQF